MNTRNKQNNGSNASCQIVLLHIQEQITMLQLLQSQLENENAILEKLKATKRDDATARYLLQRIELEIKQLRGKIHEQQTRGETIIKHRHSRGLTRHVEKALCRYRAYIHGYRNAISQIPTATTL